MSLSTQRILKSVNLACLIVVALIAARKILVLVDHAEADPAHLVRDIQDSHVNANLPPDADIDQVLRRDLGQYFASARGKAVAIDFEWLRKGPTQSGVSFPKFYLWVRLADGASIDDRGAVRVAAVGGSRFEVTDFLSERSIRAEPHAIYRVFPKAVCERISEKLAEKQ